jgi:hypothetical protein
LFAGLICLLELPFYGYATAPETTPLLESRLDRELIVVGSLICLGASALLEIAVILEEEL